MKKNFVVLFILAFLYNIIFTFNLLGSVIIRYDRTGMFITLIILNAMITFTFILLIGFLNPDIEDLIRRLKK